MLCCYKYLQISALISCFQGKYQLASVLLQHARQQFPHEPMSHAWMYTEQLLYFTEALHNGRWQEAEQAVTRMSSVHKWDSLLRSVVFISNAISLCDGIHYLQQCD